MCELTSFLLYFLYNHSRWAVNCDFRHFLSICIITGGYNVARLQIYEASSEFDALNCGSVSRKSESALDTTDCLHFSLHRLLFSFLPPSQSDISTCYNGEDTVLLITLWAALNVPRDDILLQKNNPIMHRQQNVCLKYFSFVTCSRPLPHFRRRLAWGKQNTVVLIVPSPLPRVYFSTVCCQQLECLPTTQFSSFQMGVCRGGLQGNNSNRNGLNWNT